MYDMFCIYGTIIQCSINQCIQLGKWEANYLGNQGDFYIKTRAVLLWIFAALLKCKGSLGRWDFFFFNLWTSKRYCTLKMVTFLSESSTKFSLGQICYKLLYCFRLDVTSCSRVEILLCLRNQTNSPEKSQHFLSKILINLKLIILLFCTTITNVQNLSAVFW